MRKLAATIMVFTFVAAALVSSFFGGSPSSAQDAPLLTTTPSHTPIVTPLALQNASFEDGANKNGKPVGWNNTGLKKRDRVICATTASQGGQLRGVSVADAPLIAVPNPDSCDFVFKGIRGKASVLRQDVPIESSFQPGQPIAITATIRGKNVAVESFIIQGVLHYVDMQDQPGKIPFVQPLYWSMDDQTYYSNFGTKIETLGDHIKSVTSLRLKLRYRGTSGRLNVGEVQAHALIPTPTSSIPTVPPACGGEDCPLPVRLTPTPFGQPTPPTGLGGE